MDLYKWTVVRGDLKFFKDVNSSYKYQEGFGLSYDVQYILLCISEGLLQYASSREISPKSQLVTGKLNSPKGNTS